MVDRTHGAAWTLRYQLVPTLGSRLRQEWAQRINRHATVAFGAKCRLGPGFHLEVPGRGRFVASEWVDFRRDFTCEIGGTGSVEIGDRCVFTYGVLIQCSTSVVIEPGCSLGTGSIVVDGNHRFRDHTTPMRAQGFDHRPIRIGRGATVMSHAIVIAAVGAGAVVGAGSVVTNPVPPHCLAVGAPARVIEYFGPPDQRPEGLDPSVPSTGT